MSTEGIPRPIVFQAELGPEHIPRSVNDLHSGLAPALCFRIDFLLEWVHELLIVQRHILLSLYCAVTGIGSCFPLLILIAEAHNHEVGLLDQRPGADDISLADW